MFNIIHKASQYFCYVAAISLLIMMLLTTTDVIGRGVISRPIPGTFEITKYLLAIVILLGFGYSQQTRQHVRADLFIKKLPITAQAIITSIFIMLVIIFFALVVWSGWTESLNSMGSNKVSDILRIPSFPFEFLVPLGAFLILMELLRTLLDTLKLLRHSDK